MSRDPQWARDHGQGQHLKFAASAEFSRKLRRIMREQQMSQSDLARALWGATQTPAGTPAARHRDRISKYCAGRTVPDPTTLLKLAKALHCRPEDLAPSIVVAEHEQEHPEMRMTLIAGRRDHVHVTLNTVLPLADFLQIAAIVERAKTRAPTEQETARHNNPGHGADVLRAAVLVGQKLPEVEPDPAPKPARRRREVTVGGAA